MWVDSWDVSNTWEMLMVVNGDAPRPLPSFKNCALVGVP